MLKKERQIFHKYPFHNWKNAVETVETENMEKCEIFPEKSGRLP